MVLRGLLGSAAVGAVLLVVGVGCAQAAVGHGFLSRITSAGSGSSLSEPGALAVDRATGYVFVAEPGGGEVDVYASSGAFVTSFGEGLEPVGVAVDEASGDVYVADAFGDVVDVFKPVADGGYELLSEWSGAGTAEGRFGEVHGVAVDNSSSVAAGDVYVVDSADGVVDVFKPQPAGAEEGGEGSYVGVLDRKAKLEEPNAVLVSGKTGAVYVADSARGFVNVYSASGALEAKITGAGSPLGAFHAEGDEGNVTALALEESTGDLYVAQDEEHVVSQFGSSGEWVGWITSTPQGGLVEPDGVGVLPDGEVFVSDAGVGAVDVFAAGKVVPDAKTGGASKLGKTSALLSGSVNGDGLPARYRFEYGPTEAYGLSTAAVSAGSGEEKVKLEVAGLQAGKTYHYRLVVENENGTNAGLDREFTTLPAVEGLSTGAAEAITPTGGTLTGTLTPAGVDTHYYFQWGTTSEYGNTSPAPPGVDAGAGVSPVAASVALSGLRQNTTYHYRLVAGNESYGTTFGREATFTTSGEPRIAYEPVSARGYETATLNAKVNPDELETEYRFQYGETVGYGEETPVGGARLAGGEGYVPLSAALSGLRIGTTYHYRVLASNSAGTVYGPDRTFTTVPPALIEETNASDVSSSEALIGGRIDPLGRATTYYLQYGLEDCGEHAASCTDLPAAPGTEIGSGEMPLPVSQQLANLQPATTYHYRWVALNSFGVSDGPEHTLTTRAVETPFALPDGRAWEMVSPPNKFGAPIEALTREGGVILAAEDGDSLTYVANGAVTGQPQGNRSPEMQQDIATRTANGWTNEDIATPSDKAQGLAAGEAPEYRYFTPDLSDALVQPLSTSGVSEPPLAPEAEQPTMYLRNDATGDYTAIVNEGNVPSGTRFGGELQFLDATPDLSSVVLKSATALTRAPSAPGLYEWSAGTLALVSVLPDGSFANSSETELGFKGRVVTHAVSADGTRVIWTVKDEYAGQGHLYLRDTQTNETVQLDAAQERGEPSAGSAQFQDASASDSRIFFTDTQRLTKESSAEAGFEQKPDLYTCEMVEEAGKLACRLSDLTLPVNPEEHADVQGLIFGASEDGADVYLVAKGVLASNANGNGETAEAGSYNLYHLHLNGSTWTTAFIAQLTAEDVPEWQGGTTGSDTAFSTARVSPNGRYLAFMSNGSPTGYDNVDRNSGERDEEVYLYDSSDASLRCVSCDPSGARPEGVLDTHETDEGAGLLVDRRKVWAELGREHWLAGNIPGWTAQSLESAVFQSRYLSNEGRLFFNSPDDLVPQATNRKEDVYEYEPSGVGSCQSASGGCVSLISSGSSDHESAFLEATPSGNDVFFLTAAQLVPQDKDTAFDIYDARVCTSQSPCLTEPSPVSEGCTETSSCRPAQPAQPASIGPAGTATVAGAASSAAAPIGAPKAGQGSLGAHASSPPKPLTRAQKLAKALKACRKLKSHNKRKRCERQARHRYAAKTTARKAKKKRR